MTPIQLLALTRLIKDSQKDGVRNAVGAGEYDVDFNVHIRGPIKVSEDTVATATVHIPWTEVYALLREILLQGIDELVARVDRGETLSREDLEGFRRACGMSEDLLVDTIQRAFEIKKNKSRGSIKEKIPEIEEAQERALDAIARRLDKVPRKGKVNADLEVEEITTPVLSLTPPELSETFPPAFPKKPA